MFMIKKSLKLVVLVVFCIFACQSITVTADENKDQDKLKTSTESVSNGVSEESEIKANIPQSVIKQESSTSSDSAEQVKKVEHKTDAESEPDTQNQGESGKISVDQKEEKNLRPVQVPWQDPLFKNTTLLKIYYVKIEFETPTGKSFAETGNKNSSNIKSYIGKNKEIRLKGELMFDVDLNPDSVNTTKINVLIKAIGKDNTKYKILASENYSNKLAERGNSGKFWGNTKEISSNSLSNITLFFDKESIKFKLEGNFLDKENNLGNHKYGFSMFMRCLKGKREIMGL